MTIIIPPNDFARDPGAENLLSMFRLLMSDVFSVDGEICLGLEGIEGGFKFRDRIINPIVQEYFANAFAGAQMIADNCAVMSAVGGLPPMHPLAESGDIPAFFRKALARSILDCHNGVLELNRLSKELLEEAKDRNGLSEERDINIDELCGKVNDGYTFSVTINRQLEPTLVQVLDKTIGLRGA